MPYLQASIVNTLMPILSIDNLSKKAGFRDIFASPGLKLVEWPEKAGPHLPQADLLIAIEVLAGEARALTLSAFTTTGEALLA